MINYLFSNNWFRFYSQKDIGKTELAIFKPKLKKVEFGFKTKSNRVDHVNETAIKLNRANECYPRYIFEPC